jgi:hypothetical protein
MSSLNYRKLSLLTGSLNQPTSACPGVGPDSLFWNRYPISGFSNGSVVCDVVGAAMLTLASFRHVGIWPLLEAQSQYLYIDLLMTLTSHLLPHGSREKNLRKPKLAGLTEPDGLDGLVADLFVDVLLSLENNDFLQVIV